ncbi:MAG: hypothetical protein OES38_20920, partial [Gammaproteobacteria bacterium]|nr:hypothetical protein [Gammaproteobacteria bacterium]
SYDDCPCPVRATMADGYRASWDYIAGAGNWWSGQERIAIAQASRDAFSCALCGDRKQALSPYGMSGAHDGASVLDDKVTDAVHRMTTDAARLTEAWMNEAVDDTFTYGHYVEAVSVVVSVFCIDSFHRALGLALAPLPEPKPGEPSRYWPPGATVDVAWVPMLLPETLTEPEADIFGGQPQMANVIRAMSLIPDAVRQLAAQSAVQYVDLPNVRNFASSGQLSLSRPQIELVAARTSAINDCFY